MNSSPEMIIEVSSYTDCRGSKEYNLNLSNKRTKTIINYVSKQINNPERIYGKGYGETNIISEEIFKTGVGLSISQSTPIQSIIKNETKDYIIVSVIYKSKINANSKKQQLEKLGYTASIEKVNRLFKVIVKDVYKFKKAKALVKVLKESNIKAWIINCNCCTISEENHKLNRRTEFKIIN